MIVMKFISDSENSFILLNIKNQVNNIIII